MIAFPKTQSGADLMCGAPSPIDEKQLREIHVKVVEPVHTSRPTVPDVHGVVHKKIGPVNP